jgi:dipeptidase D
MATPIDALEPKAVWQSFAEMSRVPRPSKKEERIQAHVIAWADKHGFAHRKDRAGNIVIDVPATPGCESAPITVLQGHLDMVCEKNADTQFDFDRDAIQLVVDKDADGAPIVRAEGTTLGADNGIGVAMAMAAATLPEVKHGPLELLCTADEEMGMTGAKALDPEFVKGRRMLNLDSEEDTAIYIGCAGGMDTTLTWTLPTAPPTGGQACKVKVSGLRGGHSGGDIHENRGNAIKLLVRTLLEGGGDALQLVAFTGGSKRNAIPREAAAVVCGPAGLDAALRKVATAVQDEAAKYGNEPGCTISIEPAEAAAAVSPADTKRVFDTIAALPHGVLAVVPEIAGLVQTSNSTSTVEATAEGGALRIVVGCLSRSSLRSELHAAVRQIAAVGRLGAAATESGNEYPGWAPDVKSPTLATCRRIYQELFGEEPEVTAIHAGLECGLIGERLGTGSMDMVSFGPRIEGAHSPDERIWVASVQKSWQYLVAVLAALAQG